MAQKPIAVLLADHDPLTRQCLRRALEEEERLRIEWEADNGLQVLLIAQQCQPQIILMDAQMPRMDGVEATRCLRQRQLPVRIVVMSVYEQLRAPALAAGADDFITKDCGCEALRNSLERLLDS